MTVRSTPSPYALPALARTLAWLACFGAASHVSAQATPASPASPPASVLQVELNAPDSVKPILQRHLRILNRTDQALPEARADRIALARRTRSEAAELLATEGYFKPEVELVRADDGQWRLTVTPGQQARIGEVNLVFEGDIAPADDPDDARRARREALRKAWSLPVGQAFRQSNWDTAKQQLLDGVAVRAYAAARIVASRAEVDADAASVKLSVTIDSGPAFFFGDLDVIGLERLPAGLVARYSTLEKGQPFDQERLLALQRTLQNAPQFSSVVVDIDRNPALAAAVPVRVHVSEARSRHLSFGTGYSTNTGARAEMNWRDVNLFGRGWELSTGLRFEQRRQAAYADVFLPPSGGYRDSFGVVSEASDIEGLETTVHAMAATRTRTRGDIETGLTLRYQHETLKPLGGDETQRNALTANWSWKQRKVDNVLDPRNGYVLHVEFGGGAKAALSDQDFFRSYVRGVRYWPMRERDVLILRGEGGVTLADSRDGIPQDFLFRTGGAQTVRGYAYNSLGVEEGRATLGGRYMGIASAEYVNWFKPQWGVAAFVDAGDAADDRDSFSLKTGYGIGARWRSPAGPIALDLAYGHQAQRLRLHFAIAIAF